MSTNNISARLSPNYETTTTHSIDPVPDCNGQCTLSDSTYVVCNETSYHETLSLLRQLPRNDNGVHIGWACQFNYDVIACRQPQYAIICDINTNMHNLYKKICFLLLSKIDRETFNQELLLFFSQPEIQEKLSYTHEFSTPLELLQKLQWEGSWLTCDDKYELIQDMHTQKRIVYRMLDITDDSGYFSALHSWLNTNCLEVDTLYASNIIEWLKSEDQQSRYRLNLEQLMSPNTQFIYAKRPGIKSPRNILNST